MKYSQTVLCALCYILYIAFLLELRDPGFYSSAKNKKKHLCISIHVERKHWGAEIPATKDYFLQNEVLWYCTFNGYRLETAK